MLLNLYYLIFLSVIITTAFILIFLYKRHLHSLSNPAYIASDILETINETVIITNAMCIIIFINQAGEKLLKIPQKKIVGKNISEIFSNPQTGITPNLKEINIRNEEGEIISVSTSFNKIINENQNFIGYSITLEENTTRRKYISQLQKKVDELASINNLLEENIKNKEQEEQKIEQKVQEKTFDISEEHTRLYTSIKNLCFGFIMTDKEKNIIIINNTAKNLFSIPNKETNITLDNLQTHIQGDLKLSKIVNLILTNNKLLAYNNNSIDNKYCNIYLSPVILDLKTAGAVILTEDITEEQNTEKSKEDFFTIASHELRSPLTSIRGYISLIKQSYFADIKNEELIKIIIDIDSLSVRLINIVNDFLDTPKLEQGKIRVKKEPCDLVEIVKACIKETNPIATSKNLLIKFTSSIESATALGDRDKIRQIIINLISNGIKYTEQGEITIAIEKTPNSQYKILIKDTGKGVSKENIKFLFSKFQRTDPNKPMTSTGLGLYISKLLVERMDGSISLENTEEGKGSTFSFTLHAYEQSIVTNKS